MKDMLVEKRKDDTLQGDWRLQVGKRIVLLRVPVHSRRRDTKREIHHLYHDLRG
jgi:hypothetical protein